MLYFDLPSKCSNDHRPVFTLHALIWHVKDKGSHLCPNLSCYHLAVSSPNFPPWVFARKVYKYFTTCEHLQLLRARHSFLSLISPDIILHTMHASHSCVRRGIICSRWQIKHSRKCRFTYEWASCLSCTHSHSFVCSSLSCTSAFRVQCALTTSSPLTFTSAFISRDGHIPDSFIVCFCFILFIISRYYWTWLKRRNVVLCCHLTQVQSHVHSRPYKG